MQKAGYTATKMANFASKITNSRGELLYLVRGDDAGRALWHYIIVDKTKLPLFKQKIGSGQINLAQYGQIIESGWGIDPDAEIAAKITAQYT